MIKRRLIFVVLLGILIHGIPVLNYAQNDSLVSKLEVNKRQNPIYDSAKFNIFPEKLNQRKVALVLSGGGARGLAQIGVIDVLQKYGVNIDMIVGTSIGAITGGLYSSGYTPEEMIEITNGVDWKSKLSLTNKYEREFLFVDQKKSQDRGFITISLDGFKPRLPTSLSSGQQMSDLINIFLMNARFKPKKDFSDLKIPFYSVATDLDQGKRVVLSKGNISECIKASFTYPLLYSPTKVDGNDLVDGGLTANIPVDVAKEYGADLTITVNSTSPLKTSEELKDPINTADQILSITMAQLNEEQLRKSDFVINPDLGNLGATDFDNINYVVNKGKTAAELLIKEIISKIDTLEDKASPNFNNFIFNGNVSFGFKQIPDSLKTIINSEQMNTFVRYVTIEKRLRDIYKLGNFKNVQAEIFKTGNTSEIVYKAEPNDKLRSVRISFGKDIENNKEYKVVFWDTLNTGSFDLANKKAPDNVNQLLLNRVSEIVNAFGKENINKTANRNRMYSFYESLLGGFRQTDYSAIDISRFYMDDNGVLNIDLTDGIVSEIKINGNFKTKKGLLISETDIPSDKPVMKNSLVESLGGIVGTNLFQQVSMFFDYRDTSKNPSLNFNVVEKSSRNIRLSFRLDNERKFQGYIDFRNENLFGTGNEAGLTLKGGLRDREYKAELKSNKFFGTVFTYNWSFYYRFRNIYDYTQSVDNTDLIRTENGEYRDIRLGSSFLLGTQVKRFGTIFGQLVYENLSRQSIQGIFPPEADLKLFKLRIGGRIDSEDIYPFATKGTTVNYIYESSRNSLSGGVTFTKLSFDITYNVSLGRPSVLKPKFVFGFADKTTPDYEVFSLGGEDSFYGMVEDEMRGRQVLLASLEYRYKLPIKFFFDTYLSARYDLGRIWENTEDIRFKDLKHGIGAAILFDTPIGKTSLSLGKMFIINKGLTSESLYWGPMTFYFSVGYNL
ncbi:MAG: patatin-like phospholipase family protein [Ignavibacteriota bacterium]|nr:patatin-like phospholipase family protein [Ignavibacteriota bacterium]